MGAAGHGARAVKCSARARVWQLRKGGEVGVRSVTSLVISEILQSRPASGGSSRAQHMQHIGFKVPKQKAPPMEHSHSVEILAALK